MDRQKALAVLREVIEITKQRNDVKAISINDNKGNYSLSLQCSLDSQTRQCLQPILDRDKLQLKQVGDNLIIY